MRRTLIIFAKEPKKGKVKTRLLNYLSSSQCLSLYKAFLKDTIDLANNIHCEERILAYAADTKPEYLKRIAPHLTFYKQKGNNLGIKMYNAFKFAKKNGASKTIIIGSDSPTLPVRSIQAAFCLLDKNDIVVGPSCDGGYYLIGMKKPISGLFKQIKWSSNQVLADTIKKARILNKRIVKLPVCFDVDNPQSYLRLKQVLRKPKNKSIAKWTRWSLKI